MSRQAFHFLQSCKILIQDTELDLSFQYENSFCRKNNSHNRFPLYQTDNLLFRSLNYLIKKRGLNVSYSGIGKNCSKLFEEVGERLVFGR